MSSRRGFLKQLGLGGAAVAGAAVVGPGVLKLGQGDDAIEVEAPPAGSATESTDAITDMVEVSGKTMVMYPLAVRQAMLQTREHFAALEQWGMYQKPDYDAHVFTLRGSKEHVEAIKAALSKEALESQESSKYEAIRSSLQRKAELDPNSTNGFGWYNKVYPDGTRPEA